MQGVIDRTLPPRRRVVLRVPIWRRPTLQFCFHGIPPAALLNGEDRAILRILSPAMFFTMQQDSTAAVYENAVQVLGWTSASLGGAEQM